MLQERPTVGLVRESKKRDIRSEMSRLHFVEPRDIRQKTIAFGVHPYVGMIQIR